MKKKSAALPDTKAENSAEFRIPYYKKPANLSVDEWQWKLRKQFGEENQFVITNIGEEAVFSDYLVYNPNTINNYKVSIRDFNHQRNFCNCLDFKTNRLGICKHIAATLKCLTANLDITEYQSTQLAGSYSSIYLDYPGGRQVKLKIGTEKSAEYEVLRKKYFSDNNELLATSFPVFEKILHEAKQINASFVCYEDALAYVIQIRENINRRLKIGDFLKKNPKISDIAGALKVKLFPFQEDGVKFAARAGRSLIADDMGLGKTLQAVAVAEMYKKVLQIHKVLIVCPTSLKYQWKSEIERFSNSTVEIIDGNVSRRKEQYSQSESFYQITSYSSIANDVDFINDALELDFVILDEAQRIKNWKTKVSKSVKRLNSTYTVVLTGTPLENKLEELYSIMQFIDVYQLGPLYQFVDRYQLKDPETGKVIGYQHLNEIKALLSDTLLRRTKSEVLKQLPERMDKNLFVPMTQEQREIHDEMQMVVSKLVSKWRKFGFLNEADRQKLILSLSRMRMVCDSTFIIDQRTRKDTKIEELMNILEEFFETNDSKVVIFSQWERMTRLVADELEKRDFGFEYLHGGIPSQKREKLLTNFKENPNSRIFLSTDTGGVGLNLQSASLVINLDIPWNPAVLEQRISRVYRLGQNRNVTVINLVSTGTIEHKMLDVLKFKSSMAGGVLDGGEDTIFLDNEQFKGFMESLVTLTDEIATDIDFEIEANSEFELPSESQEIDAKKEENPLLGDDDIFDVEETDKSTDLVNQGLSFFSNLMETLKNPKATQELLDKIIEKDKNGKVFLKIPVENSDVVEDGLKVLGGFLARFNGK
ncbi:MAG TPA: DEAD/DEAH box helicase [Leadbetterella sp.]|nr:DEAD/DEAH box helicase [Leadbetterella sp.]